MFIYETYLDISTNFSVIEIDDSNDIPIIAFYICNRSIGQSRRSEGKSENHENRENYIVVIRLALQIIDSLRDFESHA